MSTIGNLSPNNGTLRVTIVDVAATLRAECGDEAAEALVPGLPEHDWRFHVETSGGGIRVTFGSEYTAQGVAEFLRREGILDQLPKETK